MIIKPARRTNSIKEYYFSTKNRELAALNVERAKKGQDPIVNLGIGAPDGMPPQGAIDALCETARRTDAHKYQSYVGIPALRKAFSDWYERYYGVTLDPATEIQPLVGSKEGILIISMTYLNPGDKLLVPDPGYPTYTSAAKLAEAELVTYNLDESKGWAPNFEELEKMDLEGVKMMWINYPNMPTGAPATEEIYQKTVDFARRHGILLVNDNPYSFVLTEKPLSIFSIEGAKDCCLELNSLSKAHNMSGWRIGMVAGAHEYVAEILKVKSQMDSGMFLGLQNAAIAALSEGPDWFERLNAEYRRRRALVHELYDTLGFKYIKDSTGLFVLAKVSPDSPYAAFPESKKGDAEYQASWEQRPLGEKVSEHLLHTYGLFVTPGYIFGAQVADYVRASLCAPCENIASAIAKLK